MQICNSFKKLTTTTSPTDKNGDARDFEFNDPINGMPAPSPNLLDKLAGLLDILYINISNAPAERNISYSRAIHK